MREWARGDTGRTARPSRSERHRLHEVLHRELGETPLPDTEAIYRQALDRTMRRSLERAAVLDAERPPILVAVGR